MYINNETLSDIYTGLIGVGGQLETATLRLLGEPPDLEPDIELADIVAMSFTGYSHIALADPVVATDASGLPYIAWTAATRTPTVQGDLPVVCYGAALVDDGGELFAVSVLPEPVELLNAGQILTVIPQFRFARSDSNEMDIHAE